MAASSSPIPTIANSTCSGLENRCRMYENPLPAGDSCKVSLSIRLRIHSGKPGPARSRLIACASGVSAAAALSTEIPLRSRPTNSRKFVLGWSIQFRPGKTSANLASGSQTSAACPTDTPKNSRGATPQMVKGTFPTRTVRPTAAGFPPYARCQYA